MAPDDCFRPSRWPSRIFVRFLHDEGVPWDKRVKGSWLRAWTTAYAIGKQARGHIDGLREPERPA